MIQSDDELIDFWASSKKSKITQKDYRRIAQTYLEAAKPNSFREIPGSFLSSWCNRKPNRRNRDFQESEYSQKTRIDVLKSLYSFAYRQEYIRTNPARDIEEISKHSI